MAGPSNSTRPSSDLSAQQADLLSAALSSNKSRDRPADDHQNTESPTSVRRSGSDPQRPRAAQKTTNLTESADADESRGFKFEDPMEDSFHGFFHVDTTFDLDSFDDEYGNAHFRSGSVTEIDGDMNNDLHDKRKGTEDVDDDEPEHDDKRRESDDKSAKKPGRKPIIAEPTTKRKAQNRAAQRAFRERKEKHLKDLESKVSDLEKASESANHENGLLRAQIDRLHGELREYRRRLSTNNGPLSHSPPRNVGMISSPTSFNTLSPTVDQFNFPKFGDISFPRFGELPTSFSPKQMPDAGRIEPAPQAKRSAISTRALASVDRNQTRSLSPKDLTKTSSYDSPRQPMGGAGVRTSTSPNLNTATAFDGLFTPSIFSNANNFTFPFGNGADVTGADNFRQDAVEDVPGDERGRQSSKNSYDSYTSDQNRSPGSFTYNSCPSLSSGTTPDACHLSPTNQDSGTASASTDSKSFNSFDWLANQNGGQFDPVLFGGYRETQEAIVGDGDFTGGLFHDGFPLQDWGSPLSFNETLPTVPASNLNGQFVDQNGTKNGEVTQGKCSLMASSIGGQAIDTNKIWLELQARRDFQDGTLDIDALCAEMKSKARCTERGGVIDRKDLDESFTKASNKA